MGVTGKFEDLLNLAVSQEMAGWDFSFLTGRTSEPRLPWDYRLLVLERLPAARALLDLGTGGGEFLASLAPLPAFTRATEGYPPNLVIARERLAPLGVEVADVSGGDGRLPFAPHTFDLVIDRHTGGQAQEIHRVLQPGGRYLTQQVGGLNCLEFNRFFQDEPYYRYSDVLLPAYANQLEAAGLRVLQAHEAFPTWTFFDIAGVVFYLNVVSWQVEGFSIEKYAPQLYRLHQRIESEGGFKVTQHRFWIESMKDQ